MVVKLLVSTRGVRSALLGLAAGVAFAASSACAGELFRRGDVDQSGALDISDGVATFDYLFLGGDVPGCLDAVDANDDGALEISDGIFVLNYLFVGGREPPPPSPSARCLGTDPTADGISCVGGAEPVAGPAPEAELSITLAPPPGVRERRRELVPRAADGAWLVAAGAEFAVLLEARRAELSRAPFALAGVDGGDPSAFDVRAGAALGALGGGAAGGNLALLFARDIDPWSDPIYLLDHVVWRVDDADVATLAPGDYALTARVTDTDCATSASAAATLRIVASRAPVVRLWLAGCADCADCADCAAGDVLAHDPGSGRARVPSDSAPWLVVEIAPNPRGGAAPDAATIGLIAEPPLAAGVDLAAALVALASGGEPAPGGARFALRLADDRRPVVGNTRFVASVATMSEGFVGSAELTVENPVDYARDVQPIWNLRCTGCHELPSPFRGLEIVAPDADRTRRNLVHRFATEPAIDSLAARLVRPYFSDRSYLWRKLAGTHLAPEVGGEGTRMPQGEDPLTSEQLLRIESWILQGAP